MSLDTETLDYLATCRRQLPADLKSHKVVFGFDGVVDRVRTVVKTRYGPNEYERMNSLEEFGNRITDAAALDTSCSIEWFNERTRAGGHTSHLARATERLGYRPTIIGTFGNPPRETFTNEYDRTKLVSVGAAPETDAVEFHDGKVILSETRRLASLDWETISAAVGANPLAASIDRTEILGVGYWATIPQMPSIWNGLRKDIWPRLRDPPERVLVDPADIRRLSDDRLTSGVDALSALDDTVPVTVSMNRAEALRLVGLLSGDVDDTPMADVTDVLRRQLSVSEIVVHGVDEAILSTNRDRYRVEIPHEPEPVITTSAGDHFNAGLIVGRLTGMDDGSRLLLGSTLAGWFVRNGRPPTYDELREYVEQYETLFESPGSKSAEV